MKFKEIIARIITLIPIVLLFIIFLKVMGLKVFLGILAVICYFILFWWASTVLNKDE